MQRKLLILVLVLLSLSGTYLLFNVEAEVSAPPIDESPDRHIVTNIEYIGSDGIPFNQMVDGTPLGGLSAITYDPETGVYYALSDDLSQFAPARFYTLTIDLSDGSLDVGDVTAHGAITMTVNGVPFAENTVDPEGLAMMPDGNLLISSEGHVINGVDPFVRIFNPVTGDSTISLTLPTYHNPVSATFGVRHNLAHESLTIAPNGRYAFVATENALGQDGPVADIDQESLSRVVKFDLMTNNPVAEYVYINNPVVATPVPTDAFRVSGLVEMLALDNNGSFLALERSFSVGPGFDVRLYETHAQGALDVLGETDLFWEDQGIPFEIDPAMTKRELLDFSTLPIILDNLEGLTWGPDLPDGRRTLIVVGDNNFSDPLPSQFHAFAVTLDTLHSAQPILETAETSNDANGTTELLGDSDDPAIWVNEMSPEDSLVIATLKDGGMVVFDITGEIQQTIVPTTYGAIRYNNVDLIYDFMLDGQEVDIAIASDRQNDTLGIFQVTTNTVPLVDVTATDILTTIFGVDDGEATAYGLTAYKAPNGVSYVFVTQADGNLVAQLELMDNGSGQVSAEVVRTIELPTPTGDATDSQAEGLVVDPVTGMFYVAMEEEVGILKAPASPTSTEPLTVVQSIDADYLQPDIEGLSIYDAGNKRYLLASSQGNSNYAVFDLTNEDAYIGSFIVGDTETIDQANESDGLDVVSTPLGSAFPCGLLVVQDGANDPQIVVPDEEELENNATNFKFVDWREVQNAFDPPLACGDVTIFLPIISSPK